MKNRFLILLFTVFFLFPSKMALATLFDFNDTINNGTGSAILDVSVNGKVITATLDNTSPYLLENGIGSGYNLPAITGFGFDIADFSYSQDSIDSWTLKAFSPINYPSNEADLKNAWKIGDGSNVLVDFLAETTNGINGSIYNQDTIGLWQDYQDGSIEAPNGSIITGNPFGPTPQYFTKAILSITLKDDINLDGLETVRGYIKMQNVGSGGEGSLKMTDSDFGNTTPVPEPATMLLLGTGLIGLAGFGRRRLKS